MAKGKNKKLPTLAELADKESAASRRNKIAVTPPLKPGQPGPRIGSGGELVPEPTSWRPRGVVNA